MASGNWASSNTTVRFGSTTPSSTYLCRNRLAAVFCGIYLRTSVLISLTTQLQNSAYLVLIDRFSPCGPCHDDWVMVQKNKKVAFSSAALREVKKEIGRPRIAESVKRSVVVDPRLRES